LSGVERLNHRAQVQQPIGVGEEHACGRRMRTKNSREDISAFRTKGRARFYGAAIPRPGAGRVEDRGCERVHGAFNNLVFVLQWFAPIPQRTAVAPLGFVIKRSSTCGANWFTICITGSIFSHPVPSSPSPLA